MKRSVLLLLLVWATAGCGRRAHEGTEVWVFRHSIYSEDSGGLTPGGTALARVEAQKLERKPFDAIYSSPAERCRETAEVYKQEVGFVDEIIVVDWLEDGPKIDGSLERLPSGGRVLVFTHSPNIIKIRRHYGIQPGGIDYCERTMIVLGEESEP